VLPTSVPLDRWSCTRVIRFVVFELTQKKVATIASPTCGFVGLNPLRMAVVGPLPNVPFFWSRAMTEAPV
jgi:hypothetical protein